MKKNIYEKKFQLSKDDNMEKEFDSRINNFKSTKKEIIYSKKDNANYETFSTPNSKKDYGKNIYFIDRNSYSVGIYKIKKNDKPYSRFKNSEPVYLINQDKNNPYEMVNGKRKHNFIETGVIDNK